MKSALLLALAAVLLAGGAVRADDKVWVGLCLGENVPPPPTALVAPPPLQAQLYAVFGYNFYRLLKAEEIELSSQWSHWVMPRNDFFIRIEPLPPTPDGPRLLAYEIYKDGFIVARGRYEPVYGTPLFISGPYFHKGRLIFVLEAK